MARCLDLDGGNAVIELDRGAGLDLALDQPTGDGVAVDNLDLRVYAEIVISVLASEDPSLALQAKLEGSDAMATREIVV